MGKVGRFVCVIVPFALTFASLVCILIVMLAGITNKGSLYLMEVDTKNFSVAASDLSSLVSRRSLATNIIAATSGSTTTASSSSSANITAADLSLADSYKVALWNYCATSGSVTTCSTPQWNWAANATNTTELTELAESVAGVTVTLPETLTSALSTFSTIIHWAEIVYVVAVVATLAELLLGFFALCSRVGSCCTFLVSGISTIAIVAASALATATASIVVGTLDTLLESYGVSGSINTSYLATTWLAVAFSLASALFWMFSICCCGGSSNGSRGRDGKDGRSFQAPLVSGAAPFASSGYQRVQDPYQPQMVQQQSGIYNPQPIHQSRHTTGAYEPYSHGAV